MVDMLASRPGSDTKDALRKRIPWVPQWLLGFALRSKAVYGYNDENAERNVALTPRSESVDWESIERVLIVDDSVDTGWSVLAVREKIHELAPKADVRIASYCVMDMSEKRVSVDWWRYRNTIVLTATSRYSGEHDSFLNSYERWVEGADER